MFCFGFYFLLLPNTPKKKKKDKKKRKPGGRWESGLGVGKTGLLRQVARFLCWIRDKCFKSLPCFFSFREGLPIVRYTLIITPGKWGNAF